MIAIIDYGVGNLFSLKSSLGVIGAEVQVTGDADVIRNSEKIILPGVGAFEDAIGKLRETGLDMVILEEAAKGKPLLGICLGMQMLFEKSYEYGEHMGLGLIEGSVKPIAPVDCDSAVTATTEYGAMLTASVEKENVYGTQFHPEKSGEVGLKILKAFCEL